MYDWGGCVIKGMERLMVVQDKDEQDIPSSSVPLGEGQ